MTKKKFSKIIASVIALAFVITAVAVPMTLSASANQTLKQTWDFSTLKDSDADENGESVKTITNGDGTILHKNPNSGAIGGYWLSDNKTKITCNFPNKGNVRMNFKLNGALKSGAEYKFDFGVYRTVGNQWIDCSQMRLFYAPNALTYPEATKSLGAEGNWADIIPDSAELLCNRTDIQISDSTNNKIEFKFTAQKDYSDGYLVVWFNNNAGNQCSVYSADLYETVVEPTTEEPSSEEPSSEEPSSEEPSSEEPSSEEPSSEQPSSEEPSSEEPSSEQPSTEPPEPSVLQSWAIGTFNKAYDGTGKSPETNIIDPNNVVENDNGTVVLSGSPKNGWHRLKDGMFTITTFGSGKAKFRVNYKLANDLKAGQTYKFAVEATRGTEDGGWIDHSLISLYYCDKPMVIASNDVDEVNLDDYDEELLVDYDISQTIKKLPVSGATEIEFTAAKDYAAGGYITLWFNGIYEAAATYQVGGAKLSVVGQDITQPSSEEPSSEEPSSEEPSSEEPSSEEPSSEEPSSEEPSSEEPSSEEPSSEEPSSEEPSSEEPSSEEPSSEEPSSEEPSSEDPTVEEPTAEESSIDEPTYNGGFTPSDDVNNGTQSVETPANVNGSGSNADTGASAAPIAAMALAACAACVAFYARKK